MEPHHRDYSDAIEISDLHHEDQEEPLLAANTTSIDENRIIVDLYPPSGGTRLQHYFTKRNLKALIYTWRWPLFFFVSSVCMGIIMYIYRVQLFQGLETLSHKLSDMGYSGYILMSSLIFASAFPPIIGYGTYQTLSGYTFGFGIGFPISYLSALSGAVVCFSLSRLFIKARVVKFMARYPNLEAVVKAVEKKGFKLFVLIRLSPYPFNLLNVLFAATDISLFHFSLGTAITLLKIALHVYIGANLTSFAKHILGEDGDMTEGQIRAEKVKTFAVIVGSFITFAVMAYIYRVAKQAVKEANEGQEFISARQQQDEERDIELRGGFLDDDDEDEDEEEEEVQHVKMTAVLPPPVTTTAQKEVVVTDEPTPRDSVSLDTWDAWGDDDEEDLFKDDASLSPVQNKKLFKKLDGKND